MEHKKIEIDGDKIRVSFDNICDGLMIGKKAGLSPVAETKDEPLQCFAIHEEGGVWHWANAVIDGDTVVVSSPEIKKPDAVRYAFSGNPDKANLYNRNGFPAFPFRTDNDD